MTKKYNPKEIEPKWQKYWEENKTLETQENSTKPKYYVLDMFPYPSGVGLHVGHPKGYIATDILARQKMMQGYNVLHPMGWDAFGLPAENYAIKNKIHPSIAVKQNIATFKKQLSLLGFTYDWSRELDTTDPSYYKWTQWAFLQMFKKGLVYESYDPINWCPSCQTGLANEDLKEGCCERCSSEIERKPMRQWAIRITDYADRLLDDLEKLDKWPEHIKKMQREWIGRSEGALVDFKIKDSSEIIKVFTTRPDTLFGATYMVLAPEHPLLNNNQIKNKAEVDEYIKQAKKKTDLQRTQEEKEKTGVEIKGIKAINPVNGEEIPVWVADYVLINYGTGAIMSVPAHDQRDWEFATKFGLTIKEVITGGDISKEAYGGNGILINSDFINDLEVDLAKQEMTKWLEKNKIGKAEVNYKLRDWVFSRQRYWGEPIPLIKCESCGWVPVPEEELPLKLPEVENYQPSGTGESPLVNIKDWVETTCPKCNSDAKRETNTMPQWAGSSWYYLRYIDPNNFNQLIDKNKEKQWSPVDMYVGGAEHATRHLIYARFWHKFLYDNGTVNYEEPFTGLQNVGLIMAEDGRKMSKRYGNVINPDDIVEEFGADAIRIYEMFMGPFNQSVSWDTKGLVGVKRFLDRVWNLQERLVDGEPKDSESLMHQTIKKVSEDIEKMHFNTAISQLMTFVNELYKHEEVYNDEYETLIKLLSPFAPHVCEELWQILGNKGSVAVVTWPEYDETKIVEDTITLAVQINGKLRDTLEVPSEISEDEAKQTALDSIKVKKWLDGQEPTKVIYVKGKLVSIVV